MIKYICLLLVIIGCSAQEEPFSLTGKTLYGVYNKKYWNEINFQTDTAYYWKWGIRFEAQDSSLVQVQTGWEKGTYQLSETKLFFRPSHSSDIKQVGDNVPADFLHDGNFYYFLGITWHEVGTIPKITVHQSGILRSE